MPILQDYYPERLHCFYVIGANWFYRAMFSIAKLFMTKRTSNKVQVLASEDDLLKYFNKDDLMAGYVGNTES